MGVDPLFTKELEEMKEEKKMGLSTRDVLNIGMAVTALAPTIPDHNVVLSRLYRQAKAQALREAAAWVEEQTPSEAWLIPDGLRNLAADTEAGT